MRLSPGENRRLNEPAGFVLLILAVAALLALVSYHPLDPSANVAAAAEKPRNLVGRPGALFSDLTLQWLGLAAFLIPLYLTLTGWTWVRSKTAVAPLARIVGGTLLIVAACAVTGMLVAWQPFNGGILAGGVLGEILAELLVKYLNTPGSLLLLAAVGVCAVYLLTSFELDKLGSVRAKARAPWSGWTDGFKRWKQSLRRRRVEAREARLSESAQKPALRVEEASAEDSAPRIEDWAEEQPSDGPPIVPFEGEESDNLEENEQVDFETALVRERADADEAPWDEDEGSYDDEPEEEEPDYRVPNTSLLTPPYERTTYDSDELHATSRQIVAKFQEFKVGGSVSQINPGPVVTTYEFKPDPGVKYSKVINLSEDLCLALECESILVERIPGKSTVGIEAPNKKRELIALREIVESRAFREAEGPLTVAMGKDISGQIRVADLSKMPHLLMAGSTGSGKSVMVNAFIMSILLRSTPQEVRFIMVDPKTVELSLYHDIPHLLTPVITDMKKAANALKNATAEMERRLKLLAEHSVRNIDQFNNKVARRKAMLEKEGNPELAAELKRLPYIVIIIDELADLMMLEGRAIEESITRLAQMARAVGIHLMLATQRPSVDVITGLIKANIPARISFRLTSRIDSRTILDTMGAEALLGKGDMLYLPPATQRLIRLHGPLVTEDEIEAVCRQWKQQGEPRYETEYLAPPADEAEERDDDAPGFQDEMYDEAVRVVLEAGKASTSTLQRRLRIGYGRAASILDAMEKDGVVGPQDGSRPREVLKRPDWLAEVEQR